MTRNVGAIDKAIRMILGLGVSGWVLFGAGISGTLSYIALAVAAILILTALVNFCPLFKILGISTSK